MKRPLDDLSASEVVAALGDGTLRAAVRRLVVFGTNEIEQKQAQRRPVGVIEIKRAELKLAEKIIDEVRNWKAP